MKFIFITPAIVFLLSTSACQSTSTQNAQQTNEVPSGVHKVVVEEVLQTSNYTYLRVKEGESEQWLAVTKMETPVGGIYYYENGLPMNEFESKELKKTFKTILFLDNISSTPDISKKESPSAAPFAGSVPMTGSPATTTNVKQEVKIEPEKGVVTVAALYKDKQSYAGKTVRVKGKVTKYNSGIMDKNWVHIQDGTDNSGKFDLTITTEGEVKVGDVVIFEGIIALDKDFGYGYSYELIMEDAKVVK